MPNWMGRAEWLEEEANVTLCVLKLLWFALIALLEMLKF